MIPYYHVLYLMPHEISHLLTSKIHTDNTVRNGKINFNISFGEEGQSHSDLGACFKYSGHFEVFNSGQFFRCLILTLQESRNPCDSLF